jgi:hypothetical protein
MLGSDLIGATQRKPSSDLRTEVAKAFQLHLSSQNAYSIRRRESQLLENKMTALRMMVKRLGPRLAARTLDSCYQGPQIDKFGGSGSIEAWCIS